MSDDRITDHVHPLDAVASDCDDVMILQNENRALKQDIETLESTIALLQLTIENLKQPTIQYWPGIGGK